MYELLSTNAPTRKDAAMRKWRGKRKERGKGSTVRMLMMECEMLLSFCAKGGTFQARKIWEKKKEFVSQRGLCWLTREKKVEGREVCSAEATDEEVGGGGEGGFELDYRLVLLFLFFFTFRRRSKGVAPIRLEAETFAAGAAAVVAVRMLLTTRRQRAYRQQCLVQRGRR